MPTDHAFALRTRSDEAHEFAGGGHLVDISSVGMMLREMREQYGLTLRDVANALRIRIVYLHALEEGRFADLPGRTYAIGFLRSYADYFGLDGDEVVRRFREERKESAKQGKLKFPEPPPETKLPIAALLAILVAAAIVGYGAWQFLDGGEQATRPMVAEVPTGLALESDRLDDEAEGLGGAAGYAEPFDGRAVAALSDRDEGLRGATRSLGGIPAPARDAGYAEGPVAPVPAQPMIDESGPVIDFSSASAASISEAGDAFAGAYEAPPSPAIPPSLLGFPNAGDPEVPADLASYDPGLRMGSGETAALEQAATEVFGEVNTDARVVLKATEDCWIQIKDAAGVEVFTRLLRAGEIYKVPNRSDLALRMGNAGGLEIFVDGRALPLLGRSGEVMRNVSLDPEALLGTL